MPLAPWALALSQDGNQGRSPDTNVVQRERFELVYRETITVKGENQVVPGGRLGARGQSKGTEVNYVRACRGGGFSAPVV